MTTMFDRYLIPVTNPGLVIAAIDVATAEYDPTSIDLSKSKDAIEKCMGISYSDFLKGFEGSRRSDRYVYG